MRIRLLQSLILALTTCFLVSCVEHPLHRHDGSQALLDSLVPVIELDGQAPKNAYRLMLDPGPHTFQVKVEMYLRTYHCVFEFEAVAGEAYEIVDHSNAEPVVLYRWVRTNRFWAERVDPVRPVCEHKA